MPHMYLATIGQRPQATTVAFDVLKERYAYERIGLRHTDPERSGIATALRDLHVELTDAYPEMPVDCREVRDLSGQLLLDIESDTLAEAYFYGLDTLSTFVITL